jgi:hypothetical protein
LIVELCRETGAPYPITVVSAAQRSLKEAVAVTAAVVVAAVWARAGIFRRSMVEIDAMKVVEKSILLEIGDIGIGVGKMSVTFGW